jgi:hypothetical protein
LLIFDHADVCEVVNEIGFYFKLKIGGQQYLAPLVLPKAPSIDF